MWLSHAATARGGQRTRAVLPAAVFVASVHPLKSFADPATAVANFAGTWCVMEGMPAALAVLQPAFEQIGAAHGTYRHGGAVAAQGVAGDDDFSRLLRYGVLRPCV